jgi:thiamine transport system ATP-binding protein
LSLIAGFETPLSGSIMIAGRDMAGVPPAERQLSMIFQDNNSFAHLSVFDNVALGVSPALRLAREEQEQVVAALAEVGLAALHGRKPGELSGGERQRIAIARALVRRKPVLLLDEPFAALGPALRRDMLSLIVDLKSRQKLTVLMVSHQPEDARQAADRTAFIDRGRVLTVGDTRSILEGSEVPEIRAYLGK